jgi:hypothetical protein
MTATVVVNPVVTEHHTVVDTVVAPCSSLVLTSTMTMTTTVDSECSIISCDDLENSFETPVTTAPLEKALKNDVISPSVLIDASVSPSGQFSALDEWAGGEEIASSTPLPLSLDPPSSSFPPWAFIPISLGSIFLLLVIAFIYFLRRRVHSPPPVPVGSDSNVVTNASFEFSHVNLN